MQHYAKLVAADHKFCIKTGAITRHAQCKLAWYGEGNTCIITLTVPCTMMMNFMCTLTNTDLKFKRSEEVLMTACQLSSSGC